MYKDEENSHGYVATEMSLKNGEVSSGSEIEATELQIWILNQWKYNNAGIESATTLTCDDGNHKDAMISLKKRSHNNNCIE